MTDSIHVKDMGGLHYCLGISIRYQPGKFIEMHQKQYILKMLEKYNLQDNNPVSTPAESNVSYARMTELSRLWTW